MFVHYIVIFLVFLFRAAILMHEKNVEMKQLREDMEKKMREQLVRLCICFRASVVL